MYKAVGTPTQTRTQCRHAPTLERTHTDGRPNGHMDAMPCSLHVRMRVTTVSISSDGPVLCNLHCIPFYACSMACCACAYVPVTIGSLVFSILGFSHSWTPGVRVLPCPLPTPCVHVCNSTGHQRRRVWPRALDGGTGLLQHSRTAHPRHRLVKVLDVSNECCRGPLCLREGRHYFSR